MKRKTEKQEFIYRINQIVEAGNLQPIPFECLHAMDVVALSRFHDWISSLVGNLKAFGYK